MALTDERAAEMLLLGASRLHRLQEHLLAGLPTPLTLRQYRTLLRVGQGVTSVSELSRLAHRSVPTVSESIDGLLKRGLLTREGSTADRRAVVLELTEEGIEAVKAGQQSMEEAAALIFDALPVSKRKVLNQLAQTMYEVGGSTLWGDDA
jgi:MarR family transcriptional regulator, organic hydroperoxide resistance regulator